MIVHWHHLIWSSEKHRPVVLKWITCDYKVTRIAVLPLHTTWSIYPIPTCQMSSDYEFSDDDGDYYDDEEMLDGTQDEEG